MDDGGGDLISAIPRAAAVLLHPYLDGRGFSVGSLVERIGDTATRALLGNLVDAGMVRAV
ncbi:hypothetical protein ACFU7Y_11415 [Kitasatospora sp. NPDC057542]|uniref:hypothetical protein n=1 Tax=Kitasatospora sp. NPDC057542 TaxID=3346162 RepID=UPI003679497A